MSKVSVGSRRQERGSALVVAVITVVGIAAVALAMSQMAMTGSHTTESSADRTQAWMLVEAGFQAALQEVNTGRDLDGNGVVGTVERTFGPNDRFSYSASVYTGTNTDGSYTGQNIGSANRRLICRGSVAGEGNGASDTIRCGEAIVKDSSTRVKFPYQIFGDLGATCGGNMFMDSFDSSLNTHYNAQVAAAGGTTAYRASAAGRAAILGSNGDISLGGQNIWGSVQPGVGKSVTGAENVFGSILPRSTPYVMPAPYVPTTTTTATGAIVDGTLNSGTYHWTTFSSGPKDVLTVPANSTVTIIIDSGFWMKGKFSVPTTSTVDVFVKAGDIRMNSQGDNAHTQSNTFNIVSSSTGGITVNGGFDFYGTMYAPYMEMKGNGNGKIYGAFMVKDISKLNGTLDLHADINASTSGIIPQADLVAVREIDTGNFTNN